MLLIQKDSSSSCCLQAFSYRGPGDPSEEALHYVVQTAVAQEQTKKNPQLPDLPSGSLITGLAAAVIQHAEVHMHNLSQSLDSCLDRS